MAMISSSLKEDCCGPIPTSEPNSDLVNSLVDDWAREYQEHKTYLANNPLILNTESKEEYILVLFCDQWLKLRKTVSSFDKDQISIPSYIKFYSHFIFDETGKIIKGIKSKDLYVRSLIDTKGIDYILEQAKDFTMLHNSYIRVKAKEIKYLFDKYKEK
jgi:hypothetical protein